MQFILSNSSVRISTPSLTPQFLILLFLVKFFFVAGNIPYAWAEADSPVSSSQTLQRDSAYQQKLEQWKKLKENNPQEFQALVSRRKEEIRRHLETLETQDPDRYENLKKDFLVKRREKIREMQQRNPEQFRQRVEGRLERFKERNPEQFNKFRERHPRLAMRFEEQGLRPRQNFQDLGREPRKREGPPSEQEHRPVLQSEDGTRRESQGGVRPGQGKPDREMNSGPNQFNRPRREMKGPGERPKRKFSQPGRRQRESRDGR